MADNFFDEKDIDTSSDNSFFDQSDIEKSEPFMESDSPESSSEIQDKLVSPVGVGAGIYATQKAAEGLGDVISNVAPKVIKQLPGGSELLSARDIAKTGQEVTGPSAKKQVKQQTEDLVKKELVPFLENERSVSSKAIGKILKKAESIDTSKDTEKTIKSISKMVQQTKPATEEGKKIKANLESLLDEYVTLNKEFKVTPKEVKNPKDIAMDKLKQIQNRMTALAEETGDRVNFTDPKIHDDLGQITSFESTSQKPISVPIKQSGEFTPIDIQETGTKASYKSLSPKEISSLERQLGALGGEAVDKAKGDVIAKTAFTAKDKVGDLLTKSLGELAPEHDRASSRMAQSLRTSEALPKGIDILSKRGIDKEQASNQLVKYFREAAKEGKSADVVGDELELFYKQLEKTDPQFAEQFREKASSLAERYKLAVPEETIEGSLIGRTLKPTAAKAGELIGQAEKKLSESGLAKGLKTAGKGLWKSLPLVGAGLTFEQARAEGSTPGQAAALAGIEEATDVLGPLKTALYPSEIKPATEAERLLEEGKIKPSEFKRLYQQEQLPEDKRDFSTDRQRLESLLMELEGSNKPAAQQFTKEIKDLLEGSEEDKARAEFQLKQQPAFRAIMNKK